LLPLAAWPGCFGVASPTGCPSVKTTIVGQVLDARGKPIAGAQVAATGRLRGLDDAHHTLSTAASDAEGRYRLVVPQLSSVRYYKVYVIALAAGYALESQPVPLDVKQPGVRIRLADEEILHGRVVDSKGMPAANAMVCVRGAPVSGGGDAEGLFLWEPEKAPSVWPKPAITDAQGRFTLGGANTTEGAYVQVVDDRFARWHLHVGRHGSGTSSLAEHMQHPHVAVGGDFVPQAAPTDEVTLAPPPSQIIEGEPYLVRQKTISWPDDTSVYRVQVECPRGVLVRGNITESPSGKPVSQADIQYEPHTGNPNKTDDALLGWQAAVKTHADGTFQIAVPPGKGTLVVQAPLGYVLRIVGGRDFAHGGRRNYVHAIIPLDLDAKASPQVQANLKYGATVHVRLVSPEDKPVEEALLSSYLLLPPFRREWGALPQTVRGGEFVLYGVDPDKPAPIYILDPKNGLGARHELSARNPAEPTVVRLAPCGQAEVRYFDEGGRPVEGQPVELAIVFTAGFSPFVGPDRLKPDEWAADEDFYANFDRRHYGDEPHTDKDGRCLLPDLIPGAAYRLQYCTKSGKNALYDFVAEAGKTIHLPDLVVKRPAEVRVK